MRVYSLVCIHIKETITFMQCPKSNGLTVSERTEKYNVGGKVVALNVNSAVVFFF